jgi:hypothetical protein
MPGKSASKRKFRGLKMNSIENYFKVPTERVMKASTRVFVDFVFGNISLRLLTA